MIGRCCTTVSDVVLSGPRVPGDERVLTPEALALVAQLTRRFAPGARPAPRAPP